MTWKFWKRKPSDETTISVTESNMKHHKEIYVKAQTADKAFTLYEQLKEKEK